MPKTSLIAKLSHKTKPKTSRESVKCETEKIRARDDKAVYIIRITTCTRGPLSIL